MTNCYRFEFIQKKGSFPLDDVVDATFIMTMENSARHKHIYDHIVPNLPVSNMYIQYNKGFKKCEKNIIQKNTHDLIHANQNIFNVAKQNGWNYIMLIEDDAVVSDRLNTQTCNEIKTFLKSKPIGCYNLGACPVLQNPLYLLNTHQHHLVSQSTHACVYHRDYFVDRLENGYHHLGEMTGTDTTNTLSLRCFSYHKPLVYQTYFNNESMMNDMSFGRLIRTFHDIVFSNGLENGFDRIYLIGNVISILLLTLFIYFMIVLYKRLIK